MAEEFHLWKHFNTAPFTRYACTLVEDASTEDGYRVTQHDPSVADVSFMHQLSDGMAKPRRVRDSIVDKTKDELTITEAIHTAMVKEPGHFEAAVYQIRGTIIRGVGP